MAFFTVTARITEVVTIEVEAEDEADARSQVEAGGGERVEPSYPLDSVVITDITAED